MQSFINRVRNEDEHTDNDEKKSKSSISSDVSNDQLHVYIVKAMCMNNEKQEAYGSQSSYHEFLLKVFKGIGAKWILYKEEQESLGPIAFKLREFIGNKGTDLLKSVELYQDQKLLGLKEILQQS